MKGDRARERCIAAAQSQIIIKTDVLFLVIYTPFTHTFADALCGGSFTIRHLDGRFLKVAIKQGEIIQPDTYKMVPDGA